MAQEQDDILNSHLGLRADDEICPGEGTIIVPENKIEKECECYTSCEEVKFKDVVGSKTVKDGGIFGDLLAVARANIEDSKIKGELTETAAGEVYAQAIVSAMKEAVGFELSHGKTQKEIALIVAQTEYQHHKINLERDQYDLQEYIEKGKLSLERDLNAANIRKIDQDIQVMIAQIRKIDADITLIEHQNMKIEQEIVQSKHEVLKIDATTRQIDQAVVQSKAEVRKIDAEILHLSYQNSKIDQEIIQSQHEVFKIDSTTRQLEQQIVQSQHEVLKIDAEKELTYQKVNESKAQTSLIYQQIQKIICECLNATTALNSKVALEKAQICKISCDCANTTSLMGSQAVLYRRQAIGFNDNAQIRKFEVQAQAYAMMFETLDLDVAPSSLYPGTPTLSSPTIPAPPNGNPCPITP